MMVDSWPKYIHNTNIDTYDDEYIDLKKNIYPFWQDLLYYRENVDGDQKRKQADREQYCKTVINKIDSMTKANRNEQNDDKHPIDLVKLKQFITSNYPFKYNESDTAIQEYLICKNAKYGLILISDLTKRLVRVKVDIFKDQ